jgi:hypothetical protein
MSATAIICRTSGPNQSITTVNQEEGQVNGLSACKDEKEGSFNEKSI